MCAEITQMEMWGSAKSMNIDIWLHNHIAPSDGQHVSMQIELTRIDT